MTSKYLLILVVLFFPVCLFAQNTPDESINPGIKEIDLIDLGGRILNKNSVIREDTLPEFMRIFCFSHQEAEYRFVISRNGLFGGVVFANAESFSDTLTGKYSVISPGAGLGIRIMLNKFSRTNIALDYAWGTQGSRGFFVNLGEVF